MLRDRPTLLTAARALPLHLLPTARAEAARAVGVAGREIAVEGPVRRVILGEGRQI